MDRFLRVEEKFSSVEETRRRVRDVSWADKGCIGEIDVIVGNRVNI